MRIAYAWINKRWPNNKLLESEVPTGIGKLLDLQTAIQIPTKPWNGIGGSGICDENNYQFVYIKKARLFNLEGSG